MGNIKELSLSKALTAKSLTDLPKQFRDDCGEYWLEAIVLVRKQNLSQSYAVAKRGVDGKIVYIQDFGEMSPISGLISIHPYMYLDKERYMPYENITQMRHALIQYIGGDEEAKAAVDDIPDHEVEYQLLEIAIDAQYAGISIKQTHQSILDAVGVSNKQTIMFDREEQNDETDDDNDTGGVSEPVGENGTDESTDNGETDTDNGIADSQSDDAVPTENAQAVEPTTPEEKPKNKGGRPKGSKNSTTRRTNKK